MAFETSAVTNFWLDLAEREDSALSLMKLQKLLYFSHGWYLALTNLPLLDDQIEAWKWGPVIPSVYHEFKDFGSGPIVGRRFRELRRVGEKKILKFVAPQLDDCPGNVGRAKTVIRRVWEVYKNYSAVQLSNLTHTPDSPWYKIWNDMGSVKRQSKDIPDELIREYFLKQSDVAKRD